MADHQDTVRRMADEGHQIGLHTWHHVSLQGMTREEIAAQLGKTQQTIQAVVGPEELMLRPPYGFVDETLKQWAKTPIVCWSVDTEDWKDQNVERIVQTVTQQAEDGDIILMHDIFETSVTAALACVDRLMAQGYYFVTVEELFALRGEVPQEGRVYLSLPPRPDSIRVSSGRRRWQMKKDHWGCPHPGGGSVRPALCGAAGPGHRPGPPAHGPGGGCPPPTAATPSG